MQRKLAGFFVTFCCSVSPLCAAEERPLCPEILTRLIPWTRPSVASFSPANAPRVEVRVCKDGGLQVAAFRKDRDAPAIAFDVHRFSLSQVAVSENVFVLVMPGPYDVVVAIEYQKGIPRIAYQTATHGDISVHVEQNQVLLTVVDSGPDVPTETKRLTFGTHSRELNP